MSGLRALWIGPPLWAQTGYGRQGFYATKALQAMPEVDQVIVATTAALHQGCMSYEGIFHVPCPETVMGNKDIPLRHMRSMKMDVAITLFDVWTFSEGFGKEFPWVPIA